MSGKIQEADESNFVCEECGKPLDPVKTSEAGKKNGVNVDPPRIDLKKIAVVGATVLVLGGLGFGAYKFFGSDTPEAPQPPTPPGIVSVSVTPAETTDTVGKTVTLTAVTNPVGSAVVWSSSDEKTATVDGNGLVKLVKAGEVDITCVLNDSVKAISHITSVDKPKTGPATIDVGFGRYTGPTANGQPDGYGGTVTVTRPTYLDLLDGETLTISPGDKIVNCKFRHGKLIQGYLKRTNGEGRDFITGIVE